MYEQYEEYEEMLPYIYIVQLEGNSNLVKLS